MKTDKHSWMIILCCAIPVVLIAAIYFFGISNKYLFWLALVLCPVMHLVMMKYMHGDKKGAGDKKCH